jgi:hypothetical protein
VVQYHVDRTGDKTTLMLGQFDEQAHLDWIKENKGKAPKPVGKSIIKSIFDWFVMLCAVYLTLSIHPSGERNITNRKTPRRCRAEFLSNSIG